MSDLTEEELRRFEYVGGATPEELSRIPIVRAVREIRRLRSLIDTPKTDDFFEAVRVEAAHQIQRWGTEHDADKTPADWFWLVGYLAGKVMHDVRGKAAHHVIAAAAALLNWHRAIAGESTAMRPGIEPPP